MNKKSKKDEFDEFNISRHIHNILTYGNITSQDMRREIVEIVYFHILDDVIDDYLNSNSILSSLDHVLRKNLNGSE